MKKVKILLGIAVISFAIFKVRSCGKQEGQSEEIQTETQDKGGQTKEIDSYACPMHPEVTGKKGDKCTKCGMNLTPVEGADHSGHNH